MKAKITKKRLNQLVYDVTGAAIEVHRILGPGLLESVYHECMKHELTLRNIPFVSEKPISVDYKDLHLASPFRCDLLVDDILVVELKAVTEVAPIFQSILMSHMRLLKLPKGLLINFNVQNIVSEGQFTYVNEWYFNTPEE